MGLRRPIDRLSLPASKQTERCGGGNLLTHKGLGSVRRTGRRSFLAPERVFGPGRRVALTRYPPPRGRDGPISGAPFSLRRRFTLDIAGRLPYLPLPRRCPGPFFPASKTRENQRAFSDRSPPPGGPEKKALDFNGCLRETGNPPLDGTGSLKTEQRRTREGGRKSSPHGGLRDSFEGLVRRDEPGFRRRWRRGLQ